MHLDIILLQITLIGLAGFAAQWAAWKLRLPAIVFLLGTGFVFGPILGVIRPQVLLGDLMQPFIAVSVAIILFEASLNLNFKEIRGMQRGVRRLVLIGAPLSWLLTALGAHYIGGLSWPVAVTFGGLLVVTGPTVIIPLLRAAHLTPRVSSILKWEGVINDPVGVLFTIIAYEFFVHMSLHDAVGSSFYLNFFAVLVAVCAVSAGLGFVTAAILRRGHVPEYLKSYFLFIVVIALFVVANSIKDEMGLIAVTVMGITLGNANLAGLEDIRRFKETVTLLLISGVFILLTADLDPALLLKIDIRGLVFILAVIVLFRPLAVLIARLGTSISFREALFIGIVAPRGVVCAAIAGVIGPLLAENGFTDGEKILPLAFAVVITTVVLHSVGAKFLGQKLKLSASAGEGLIIAGASPWTLDLAKTLKERNIPVLVADSNWHRLQPVRLAGISFYYGEILSDEAEFAIDHGGYGALLAATDNHAYNTLICSAFARDFGHERVWQVAAHDDAGPERKKIAGDVTGRVFVAPGMTYDNWWRMQIGGAVFKATNIGAEKTGATEKAILADPADIKIGLVRGGKLLFKSPDHDPAGKDGDILLWLTHKK